jgi:acyl carrier protein
MADQDAVRSTVLEILGEVLGEPVPAITKQPVLAAHNWDSMSSLEALAQLESRLGVEVDLRSFHAVRTIDELVELAQNLVAA